MSANLRTSGSESADRIALIASSYAPAVGGVEETVRRVAVGLQRSGRAVEVWSVDRDGRSRTEVIDGIAVRYLPTPLPAGSVGGIARFLRAAPRAWREWTRAYRAFRPTIAHVHCFGPNGLYGLALSGRRGIPLVVTSHGETMADDGGVFTRSALLRTGLRRALRRARAVTAPSRVVLADLATYGLRGGDVIPNGVDLSVTVDPAVPGEPTLFAVGRLGRMKGFDLLIEAFAVAELDPAVRLVIGGDGAERADLERRIAAHGLGGRVELRGWMSPADVARAMAGALAVVVPSRMEAFGLVALEAWRSGAPLVMTSRGGAGEFVHDGVDGVLVDPEDRGALANALERVVADAELRRALAAAGRVQVREFGWDRAVERYGALYDGLRPRPKEMR
ncbi:glycosyltransferase family 4 protein [Microbacterium lacus]|uniref:D-inositol 3-phosphate glycosyltransferase n=1 Tax=Microbacterium lacus TaxID=415217 RepID=A0ABN2G2F0_9MICO